MQLDCILLAVQLLANFGIGRLFLHNSLVLQRKVAVSNLVFDAVGLHPARSATAREQKAPDFAL